MFLSVFEDGAMGLVDELTDDDFKASDDGVVFHIDVSVANPPRVYNEGEWPPILEWEE